MTTDAAQRPPFDKTRLSEAAADRAPALPTAVVVEVVDQAASTNALATRRAQAGAAEGLVVVTEHQTSGRGRLDRVWETPPRAAVTFSLVLRPQLPADRWPWLPLLTGYAVTQALRAAGYAAGVKWPNDVLIDDRKVAGILVERIETPQGPAAVVGIGLNVTTTAEELPVATATSLVMEDPDRVPDRTDLLATLVGAVWAEYDRWSGGGDAAADRLRAAYTSACVTLGRDVRVELPAGEPLTGRATGIDATGRLEVRVAGATVAVGAGDVVHVRPAV
ncbi:biotin--[acetyl-CoA-carboxylase] ligase [Nocardioides ferulae]|uniref:biotin--[acetyl-CoA-carboxylase] ligase n=1 Tax=Nocardioides ferulae TaxID=2340821 RepID=UPI001F0C064D|nr:biotin--[acetyl-CoA-carboxylase] ligase [Nocardioides ferulae]